MGACLEAWLTLTSLNLRQPPGLFKEVSIPDGSLLRFIRSFYNEKAGVEPRDATLNGPTALKLQQTCFMLVQRTLLETDSSSSLIGHQFLANFCHVHLRSAALSRLMSRLWKGKDQILQDVSQRMQDSMLKLLESSTESQVLSDLQQMADIAWASPDVGARFVTGSDFLDALVVAYGRFDSIKLRKAVLLVTYLGLLSLITIDPPNISLLSDHLYSLKAQTDQKNSQRSLLAELVTNTPLLTKLRRIINGRAGERLLKLLDTLETYRSQSIAHSRKRSCRKADKGKGKEFAGDGELHIHRMSLIAQVQDLFPDLGSGFLLKLLDEYDDDVEQVTAHLLDESLPPHLRDLDRTEEAPVFDTSRGAEIDNLIRSSTPPPLEPFMPNRRNVFDNDAFDRLEIDTAKLHVGKRKDVPAEGQPNKAAILSALAAFDSDDDERDDTYDIEDVGGTVDIAHPDGEPGPTARVTQEENDVALFTAYKASPELFGRTFNIRRGQARQALKAETGMTDEAIEGWAVMLQRDPKRLQRLEAQLGSFDGKQSVLARTSFRDSPAGTETEDSDAPRGTRGGLRGRGPGRGRGGPGRAGNVAGSSSDPSTTNAQRRKEANKGSRANHNRRDQRARKMARGGFAG